ncbi:type VI secretion protein IcmF/TssM N-terminal domain-containing protein [Isosphaeraceae bacterium EP7]
MNLFQTYLTSTALGIITALGLGTALAFAWFRGRLTWRLVVGLVAVSLAILFLVVLPRVFPDATASLGDLPELFRGWFWAWLLAFALGVLFSVTFLVRVILASRPSGVAEPDESRVDGRYPEIDAAWDEILLRLAQARIELADQHVYLVLSPDEDAMSSLVESAGLQVFARAPEGPAPLHAYAVADGVLISVSGASAFGMRDSAGAQRLEDVCHKLRALDPDRPALLGVVVLVPLGWAGQPDSVKWAASVRDDLRAIERSTLVSCPVFALFGEMESAPGFAEFLARMSPASRQGRCGFAVPPSREFDGDLARDGLAWMAGWFDGWALSLMADDPMNSLGNGELLTLGNEFRRYRKRLRSILESAFSTMRPVDPVQFRGCYFAATGHNPSSQAFAAGLFRGPTARVIREHVAARWTTQAVEDDRRYRRLALVVAGVGLALLIPAWFYILAEAEWLRPLWYAALAALVVAWIYAGYRIFAGRHTHA